MACEDVFVVVQNCTCACCECEDGVKCACGGVGVSALTTNKTL